MSPRLLIVSNRLPVVVTVESDDLVIAPSAGGLATGLRGPHERSDGLWIGWPGTVDRMAPRLRELEDSKLASMRTVPVHLSEEEVSRFYDGFANEVLWPLFHYLLDVVPPSPSGWNAYRAANERYAEVVMAQYREGDLVWVHDYHLMLVPGMLRERLPEARIGFFLHIPFPSTELFRTLPWRRDLLAGVLGADVVGFHTFTYLRHFSNGLLRFMGLEAAVDHVEYEGREVRLGVFPMGVDTPAIEARSKDPAVSRESCAVRDTYPGQKLVLGIDRLDYTKGISHRLLAIERLFESEPAWRDQMTFMQVAVPSRERVRAYESLRRRIEEAVGHVNGLHGTTTHTPVHYVFRAHSSDQVTALYKATEVMLVTPLRDGMNLVAKEFVASRTDGDGVLILSELTGAAAELGDALLVNPYDIDQVASAIGQAMTMPEEERRARMAGLRARVKAFDVHAWATSFIEDLAGPSNGHAVTSSPPAGEAALLGRLATDAGGAAELVVLLDVDGTLVALAARPELARPDDELMALLRGLAERPATRVFLVTGRSKTDVERWFGDLPLALAAEQGAWSRSSRDAPWAVAGQLEPALRDQAVRILRQFAARTPGAFVEEKELSMAWHYRAAEVEFGAMQAIELRLHLAAALSNAPVEVIAGDKVVEVRPYGISKAAVARRAQADAKKDACVLCIGNDGTDEEMFAALAPPALTVHVGRGRTLARYRLPSVTSVRQVLRSLLPADGP